MNFKAKFSAFALLLCVLAPTHAYRKRAKEYGYFDLSAGPNVMENNKFGSSPEVEYKLGPCISTSVGLTYNNGLGLSLNYIYTYNAKRERLLASGQPIDNIVDTDSTDLSANVVKLGFIYKVVTGTDISLMIKAGPCVMSTTDQTLRLIQPEGSIAQDTSSGNSDVAITLSDATTGLSTASVSVSSGSSAGDDEKKEDPQPEYISNFSFGYDLSAGLEYRQNRNRAFGLEFGYLKSHVYKSSYADQVTDTRVIAQQSDELESTYVNLLIRYYI